MKAKRLPSVLLDGGVLPSRRCRVSLGSEQLELARTTGHEQEDDALGAANGRGAGVAASQEMVERNRAQPDAALTQELPSRDLLHVSAPVRELVDVEQDPHERRPGVARSAAIALALYEVQRNELFLGCGEPTEGQLPSVPNALLG